MEDCSICYNKMKTGKTLPCQHKLCHSCYLRLDNCSCPFCRKNFTYSKKDLLNRDKLNIDYSNWQPPSELMIPQGFNVSNNTSNTSNTSNNIINNRIYTNRYNNIFSNPQFSRINRNRKRKKRRDLSMKEILERRRIIKKKCKRKWLKKNRRSKKINWWEIPV